MGQDRRRRGDPRRYLVRAGLARRAQEDARIEKDHTYGEVESVKAVSDLISPLSGRVLEVNQKVVDAPETVNEDPYGEGWLVRIALTDPAEVDQLLDAEAYRKLVAEQ